jgi:integrase|tara:strand:- start:213 stop:617 length:405 start_codon:yes stop_codon:yes gene_type:complete
MPDKVIVLNDIAKSVVDSCRGNGMDYVFGDGCRLKSLNGKTWAKAWRKAGLPTGGVYSKGVHNLRHTFAARLRMLGAGHETRQVLMGHSNKNMTSHYSAAGIEELLEAVQLLCNSRKTPAMNVVRLRHDAVSVA